MRVLVTGCNGQVGRSLVEQLDHKVDLLAVDRTELDITQREAVFKAVEGFSPDFVINAAAHTAVDKAEQEPELSFAINRDGPLFLAQASKSVGATLMHISTDYVFTGDKVGEYVENDEPGPLGVYGKSKLAGERAIAEANERHIILRTAWVFGEHGHNFVKTMLKLGKERDALSIVGDQFGGPTYAGDIAKALITIINELSQHRVEAPYGIYHFSGEPHVSWYQFAQSVFEQAEQAQLLTQPKLTSIPTEQYPTPAARPGNSKMNCSKIKDVFGIESSDWQLALNNIEAYTG